MNETLKSLRVAWSIADDAWQAELERLFGRRAGTVRYTDEGSGEPGTELHRLYGVYAAARDTYQAALAADQGATTAYFTARVEGEPAEARINGILRGGFLHNGVFYAHAGPARGVVCARAEDLSELLVYSEEGEA